MGDRKLRGLFILFRSFDNHDQYRVKLLLLLIKNIYRCYNSHRFNYMPYRYVSIKIIDSYICLVIMAVSWLAYLIDALSLFQALEWGGHVMCSDCTTQWVVAVTCAFAVLRLTLQPSYLDWKGRSCINAGLCLCWDAYKYFLSEGRITHRQTLSLWVGDPFGGLVTAQVTARLCVIVGETVAAG